MNKRIIDLRVNFKFFYERLDVCINFSMCEKSVSHSIRIRRQDSVIMTVVCLAYFDRETSSWASFCTWTYPSGKCPGSAGPILKMYVYEIEDA